MELLLLPVTDTGKAPRGTFWIVLVSFDDSAGYSAWLWLEQL